MPLNLLFLLMSLLPLLAKGGKVLGAVGKGALAANKTAMAGKGIARGMKYGRAVAGHNIKKNVKFGLGDAANLGITGLVGAEMLKGPLIEQPEAEAAALEQQYGGMIQGDMLNRQLASEQATSRLLDIPGQISDAQQANLNPYDAIMRDSNIQAAVEAAIAQHQELLSKTIQRPASPSLMDMYRTYGGS